MKKRWHFFSVFRRLSTLDPSECALLPHFWGLSHIFTRVIERFLHPCRNISERQVRIMRFWNVWPIIENRKHRTTSINVTFSNTRAIRPLFAEGRESGVWTNENMRQSKFSTWCNLNFWKMPRSAFSTLDILNFPDSCSIEGITDKKTIINKKTILGRNLTD